MGDWLESTEHFAAIREKCHFRPHPPEELFVHEGSTLHVYGRTELSPRLNGPSVGS